MRARNYILYLYLIVKDLKRAFKPFSYYNIIAISRYRALISNNLYNLYITITALLKILRRETNNEKFAHSIIKSKNNNNNARIPRLIIH